MKSKRESLDEETARYEVNRLKVLRESKKITDGFEDYMRVLLEFSDGEDHAHKTIGNLIGEASQCPTPAELKRLLLSAAQSKPVCSNCHGSGHVPAGQWLVTEHPDGQRTRQRITDDQVAAMRDRLMTGRQMIYDGSEACPCNVGRSR